MKRCEEVRGSRVSLTSAAIASLPTAIKRNGALLRGDISGFSLENLGGSFIGAPARSWRIFH